MDQSSHHASSVITCPRASYRFHVLIADRCAALIAHRRRAPRSAPYPTGLSALRATPAATAASSRPAGNHRRSAPFGAGLSSLDTRLEAILSALRGGPTNSLLQNVRTALGHNTTATAAGGVSSSTASASSSHAHASHRHHHHTTTTPGLAPLTPNPRYKVIRDLVPLTRLGVCDRV